MGILDTMRGGARALFGRPQSLGAAIEKARVVEVTRGPPKAEGISGVANYFGRIQREPIAELRDQAGFGRPGYEWGFWEDLSAANSYVAAALDFILAPVADCRIDIEPPPEGVIPDALAEEVTDFVRWALTEKLRLSAHVGAAARGALKAGFSLYEPTYAQAVDGPHTGRWYATALEERLSASLSAQPWKVDEAGRLVAVEQQGPRGNSGAWVTLELPADRVLLYTWQRQGTDWSGRSAFRAVQYIAGYVMPTLLKLVGVTLQREGAGIPVVTSKDSDAELTTEQRTQLVTLMANLVAHESANVVMPKGWQLEWVFSGGANKGHVLEVWRELGIVVLQQLGAQQLALGSSNTGSRSVGEVHDARARDKVREVLGFTESVLNGDEGFAHTGLVQRLVRFNFGALPVYPRVKLTMRRPELPVGELTTAASQAKSAGLLTPTLDDENSLRERLGFAPIDDETREAEKEKAAARAPQLQPGYVPPGEKPEDDKLKASAQRAPWQPWRPLRASESKLKLSALDEYFTARREAFEKRAQPAVLAALALSAPALEKAMADGALSPAEVASLPLDMRRVGAVVDAFVRETARAGGDFVREELPAPALRGAEEEEEREDEAQKVRDEAEEVLDAQAQALKRRMENRLRADIEREAIDALRTGAPASDVVERVVARQLDAGSFKADAGAVVTKAFNVGRDEAARLLGGVAEVELTAILDSATCVACTRLDGQRAAFDSSEHDKLLPPVRDCAGGDNCRCLLVFIPEVKS